MQVTVKELRNDISINEMQNAKVAIVTETPLWSDWRAGDLVMKTNSGRQIWNIRLGCYTDNDSAFRIRPLNPGDEVTIKIEE
jgi:hypothetical protein